MVVAQGTFLSDAFARYQEIERETVEGLGEKNAHVFLAIWNDYFEFENAIEQVYPQDKRTESLVAVRLWEFSRELHTLQVLFLCGNYALLRGRLRFIWEMIFRAFYADTYEKKCPSDPDVPGPSLDEKSLWLEKLEEKGRLRWNKVMEPILSRIIPLTQQAKNLDYCHKLWKNLNNYVHPTHSLVEEMIDHDALLIDRFNEEWAKATIAVATDVFDLIWLVVFERFPGCAKIVASQGLGVQYPATDGVLKKLLEA